MTAYSWNPLIIAHTAAALVALGLGTWLLMQRKGTVSHRWLGRLWIGLMAVVALSSFWIMRDGYSWIHGLSVFTLITLVSGWWLARRRRIALHRRNMLGLYFGALVVTGLFTLLPNRLIGQAAVNGWNALMATLN
jgi:uncharacterized membrane protein